jgi:hypothetical protein
MDAIARHAARRNRARQRPAPRSNVEIVIGDLDDAVLDLLADLLLDQLEQELAAPTLGNREPAA